MNSLMRQMAFKSMLFLSMLLFFSVPRIFAQKAFPHRSHAINEKILAQTTPPDTLTIIAVRVAFQPDNNRLTTGDGTFDPKNLSYLDSPDITIDPLPHNKSYFESHLQFAKNYFETVSGHQIFLRYRILPDIYHLKEKMEQYSPTGKNFTNEKLAKLVRDTWQTVKRQGGFSTSDLDPQKTAFIIFHAGVGRDVQLVGTTLDKTPQDIPSLFLGKESLGDLLGKSNFDGFNVNNSNFKVTNSIILPRTLSRPGEDVTGQQYVLQLSLNGLLCASIGSYLGLPDLFNTKTGNSGIGRFGLMDGESFFSYQGLFPPEPSAWEKIYLGWQSPFSITANTNGPVSLPAASFHQRSSIAKYNLSGSEYFLVENRHRDPSKNGVTLTIRQPDGSTVQKHFDNSNETFVNQSDGFTKLFPRGVVTNVSNFDWSLPGGLNPGPDDKIGTPDDQQLDGGILIWHIDQAVIQNEMQSHAVNANPRRRGVDLEEADGAQDIGRAANDNFSQEARGTAFDFWWKGNNASVITSSGDTLRFYQNRFGPDTRPSNDSNSGAPSFFEFYDFSDVKPVATFYIRPRSKTNIQPVALPNDSLPDQTTFTTDDHPYFTSYPLGLSIYKAASDSFLVIPTQHSTYAINLNDKTSNIFDFNSGSPQQPYAGSKLILGTAPQSSPITINAWQWDGTNWKASWDTQASPNSAFLSSLNDQILLPDFTKQRLNIDSGAFLSPAKNIGQQSIALNGKYTQIYDGMLNLNPKNKTYSIAGNSNRLYTGALHLSQNNPAFYLLTDTKLMVFDPDNFADPQTIVQNTPLGWPAMTDINGDGQSDFIFVNRKTHQLEARNSVGAMLSYFPITPPEGTSFIGTPLIAASSSGTVNIYVITQDSLSMNIEGYSADGKMLNGFPLYVGSVSKQNNQPVHPILSGQTLFAVSHHGELKAWKMDDIKKILWASRYGNDFHNKPTGNLPTNTSQPPPAEQQILVKGETYNWPNPAHNFTNLRYQTRKAGRVSIKIITTDGSIVYNRQLHTRGDMPEEFRISTQNWSSGLYLAMISASVDGRKAHKMIKIVVVH